MRTILDHCKFQIRRVSDEPEPYYIFLYRHKHYLVLIGQGYTESLTRWKNYINFYLSRSTIHRN